MRPEDLQVNLRPRSPWEAMELGTALLRRHAAAVWRPWLLAMVLVLVLANAVAWALDRIWLGLLLAWWLKPVLERIPLYVLSRAVFGQVPGTLATLRAQAGFCPGQIPAALLWRRFTPARSLLVPVDLLEGNAGERRTARRRAVAAQAYAQAVMLTLVSMAFELVLALGLVALVLLFLPQDLLPDSLRETGQALARPWPAWLKLGLNLVPWAATLVIGPFYVAAGFGMYLNRRSGSEAWDVELAFRRLRRRLLSHGAPLLLALLAALPLAARAAPPAPAEEAADPAPTLPGVFGDQLQEDTGFLRSAAKAYRDPLLNRERTVVRWRPRQAGERTDPKVPDWLGPVAASFAMIAELGLWLLLGLLLLVLLFTARRWLPWLRARIGAAPRAPRDAMVEVAAGVAPDVLPEDVPAAVRRLWSTGRARAALALLYRASVEAMATRARIELPPGATEAQCLRAASALAPDAGRTVFAHTVRAWQYAAYAGSLPDEAAFEALLDEAVRCWGWRA